LTPTLGSTSFVLGESLPVVPAKLVKDHKRGLSGHGRDVERQYGGGASAGIGRERRGSKPKEHGMKRGARHVKLVALLQPICSHSVQSPARQS